MAPATEQYWRIVGGATTDGIIVRSGQGMQSTQAARRLSTGAVVLQRELAENRLRYTLASGNGPQEGWVSIQSQGKELARVCEKPLEAKADPKAADLRDPEWLDKLESEEITVGHLKAVVTRRPEGAPKAPLAVIMLPGNPIVNSYHAGMPLPLAVGKAFGEAGFPVIRFDWDGTGMNRPGTREPSQDYEPSFADCRVVYEYAVQNLGRRVVLCAWNYSGTVASKIVLQKWPEVCALVSLSFGYKQWEFVGRFVHEWAGIALRGDFEEHSQLEVPALYVFGSRDVHTPEDDVRRIVAARPDGGAGARLHVVDQSGQKAFSTEYFMMKDREEEVSRECAAWLSQLRAGCQAAESPLAGA